MVAGIASDRRSPNVATIRKTVIGLLETAPIPRSTIPAASSAKAEVATTRLNPSAEDPIGEGRSTLGEIVPRPEPAR